MALRAGLNCRYGSKKMRELAKVYKGNGERLYLSADGVDEKVEPAE